MPDITERVKSYEDACQVLGIPSEFTIATSANMREKDIIRLTADHQDDIICEALNEGWIPDWSDNSQYKYTVWLRYSAGSGFAFFDYGDGTITFVGSRLHFKSPRLAEYFGKQFIEIHNKTIL